MSLTNEDLYQIRRLFDEAFDSKITPVMGELGALRIDIKEIYDMIAVLEKHSVVSSVTFRKLPAKEQILQLNAALVALAKKQGITLPR